MNASTLSFLISICFAVCVLKTNAQSVLQESTRNYKNGIIITLQGDTLQGQIDYKQWRKNPYTIMFTQQGIGEKELTAKDIKEFQVEGDMYRAETVDLDVSPTNVRKLNDTPIPTVVKDTTLFLLQLVGGKVNLYYYQDIAAKDHFFYQAAGEPAKELGYYRYYVDDKAINFQTKETYKGQLKVLALACEQEQLNHDIAYLTKDLVQFFVKYNSCIMGEDKGQVKSNVSASKGKFEPWVNAGIQYTRFDFIQDFPTLGGGAYKSNTSQFMPVVGLGLDYIFPRAQERYALSANMIYSHQEVTTTYHLRYKRTRDLSYKISTLQFFGAFRYSIPWTSGVVTYVSAGPTVMYFLDVNSEENKSIGYIMQPIVGGVALSLGTSWKRYGFELRFHKELPNWHSEDGYSKATHFSGLLSYHFSK